MSYSHKLRYGVKLLAACIWTVTLPASYNISKKYPVCSAKNVIGRLCFSQYMVVVAIYLTTNVMGMALFLVPAVGSYIETSNSCICKILSWWRRVKDLSYSFVFSFYN
jgi:callose synthase